MPDLTVQGKLFDGVDTPPYANVTAITKRRRPNLSSAERNKPWAIYYRAQMMLGKQFCRLCLEFKPHSSMPGERNSGLQWGHIKPFSKGGKFTVQNITILCGPCNMAMGNEDYTGRVASLEAEWERIKMTVDIHEARKTISSIAETAGDKSNPQRSLTVTVDELKENIIELTDILHDVFNELEILRENQKKAPRRRDELTEHAKQILEFLKQYPGMALQVGSIATNLDMTIEVANSGVGSLYTRDLIKRRAPMKSAKARTGAFAYYYEPEKVTDNG